jgi:hypothetical protein
MRLARQIVAAVCAVAASGVAAPAAAAATSLSVAAPGSTGNVRNIACPSPSSCWAVGEGLLRDNGNLRFVARIMHFNGKAWTTLKVPVPAAVTASHGHVSGDYPLSGVTCTSPKNCWAVGYTRSGDVMSDRDLVLHWDGRHWTDAHVATPHGKGDELDSVTCVTASNCWAVGSIARGVFDLVGQILHWDGHAWRSVPVPASYALDQVRCERAQCWAVGDDMVSLNGAQATASVLLHLVGGRWVSLLPDVPLTFLSTVSCPSAQSCWLTGYNGNQWGLSHWDGTSTRPTVRADAPGAVTCPSATSCWFSGSQDKTARMYHWNGTAWKAFASPTVHRGGVVAMACASSRLCWAGGSAGSGYNYNIVLLRWNGKRWARSL